MFAVMKTGGKQYRVRSGDVLRVEKLDAEAGERVQFNDVLMVGETVGAPLVDDAAVQAEVIEQIRGDKVIHFVKRRRKHGSKRTKGHRQQLTLLRVTDILESGAGASDVKAAVGAGSAPRAAPGDGRYTDNRMQQAEMKRRVTEGEAREKPQDTAATPRASSDSAAAQSTHDAAATQPTPEDTAATQPTLLDAPREGGADDLKKLSGVGPKLEEKLNQNGVWHFDQIAGWGAGEIAWMDDKLSFKGRIEREGWVEQARTLAEDKE